MGFKHARQMEPSCFTPTGPQPPRGGRRTFVQNSAGCARRAADVYFARVTEPVRREQQPRSVERANLTNHVRTNRVRASLPAIPSEVPNHLSKARINPRTVRTRPDPRLSRSELHRRNHALARPSNCGRSARGTRRSCHFQGSTWLFRAGLVAPESAGRGDSIAASADRAARATERRMRLSGARRP